MCRGGFVANFSTSVEINFKDMFSRYPSQHRGFCVLRKDFDDLQDSTEFDSTKPRAFSAHQPDDKSLEVLFDLTVFVHTNIMTGASGRSAGRESELRHESGETR